MMAPATVPAIEGQDDHERVRPGRLVVVSNRLPVMVRERAVGGLEVRPATGGLVTALLPVLRAEQGTWIGWLGVGSEHPEASGQLAAAAGELGVDMRAVPMTDEEAKHFYLGFSNEVIWPLFHDLQSHCNFDPAYWQTYVGVNRRFAQAVREVAQPDDFVWIHDYHLMNVASELRRQHTVRKLGFFLHIPFPPPDIFVKLPWRDAILRSLLEYDLVGFQTLRDRRNFVQCVRGLAKDVRFEGKGQVLVARTPTGTVRVGHFPIGIDYADFARAAASPEVGQEVARLRQLLPNRQLILGVDRLDYTKGIVERLQAFQNALHRYPDLHERVTLMQVVVPSREDIPMYHKLRTKIEQLVGRINGEFTKPGGWVPIHYLYRALERTELLAYYRAAEIGLVTPLKDGMNLVAKEYCTCSIDENCVLILSEFAGAAPQLRNGALIVNPYNIEAVADAIHRAYYMPPAERQRRMRKMRRSIQRRDVFWWVHAFLRAAEAPVREPEQQVTVGAA